MTKVIKLLECKELNRHNAIQDYFLSKDGDINFILHINHIHPDKEIST